MNISSLLADEDKYPDVRLANGESRQFDTCLKTTIYTYTENDRCFLYVMFVVICEIINNFNENILCRTF